MYSELHEIMKTPAAATAAVQMPRRRPLWKEALLLLAKLASIALTAALLFSSLFGFISYQDHSMAPAVKGGDLVIYHRYTASGYLPGDAVVLNYNGRQQVRRVAAKSGDTVDITERGLVINGDLQQEPEIHQKTERYAGGVTFPLTVPEGHVFVLADSREGAADSRVYGCVKVEDTLGKVMTVIRRKGI